MVDVSFSLIYKGMSVLLSNNYPIVNIEYYKGLGKMYKTRLYEMDMLRGIAIIGVILIHITAVTFHESQGVSEAFLIAVNQISRFAVPVFLFLSGLGLAISNRSEEGYFHFLWRRISKIVPLYLIWTTVYLLFKSIFEPVSFMVILKGILTGETFYHLYYVPLIILFYILYPFVKRVATSNVAMLLILILTITSQLSSEWLGLEIANNPLNLLNWCIYFPSGIWFASHLDDIKNKLRTYSNLISVGLVLACVGIVTETFIYLNFGSNFANSSTSMRPSVILYTFIFIGFMMVREWKENMLFTNIEKLSRLSYGIYLSHALILTVWVKLVEISGVQISAILFTISSFIFVLFCSIITTKIVNFILMRINYYIMSLQQKIVTGRQLL